MDQHIVIVNPETSMCCALDEIGEIWLSGPHIAQGYWERPEETERTFRAKLADTEAAPFLRTGDLGFIHEGELIITGRYKDLIIIEGHNHYPQGIEYTVEQSHPAIRRGVQRSRLMWMARSGSSLSPKSSGAIDHSLEVAHPISVMKTTQLRP